MESGVNRIFAVEYVVRDFINTEINPHTDATKVNIKKKLLEEFNLHTIIRMPHSVFAPYTSITTNILFFDNTHPTEETWFYRLDMPEGYKNFSKTKPMKLEHFAPVLEWWDKHLLKEYQKNLKNL